MEALRLVWDEAFLAYDFGPGHPMAPIRLDLAARLMRELGLLSHPDVSVVPATTAPDAHLHLGVRQQAERSGEHTPELQSPGQLVCRLLLEKKKTENGTGRIATPAGV